MAELPASPSSLPSPSASVWGFTTGTSSLSEKPRGFGRNQRKKQKNLVERKVVLFSLGLALT